VNHDLTPKVSELDELERSPADCEELVVCHGWDKADADRLTRDAYWCGFDGRPVDEVGRLYDAWRMLDRERRDDV
jgi:hypothetical protein